MHYFLFNFPLLKTIFLGTLPLPNSLLGVDVISNHMIEKSCIPLQFRKNLAKNRPLWAITETIFEISPISLQNFVFSHLFDPYNAL